jgi:hypothetical protein
MEKEKCQGCFDEDVAASFERARSNQPPTHECGKEPEKPPSSFVPSKEQSDDVRAIVQQEIANALRGALLPPGITRAPVVASTEKGKRKR